MPPISTGFLGKTGLARLTCAPVGTPARTVTAMAKKKGARARGATPACRGELTGSPRATLRPLRRPPSRPVTPGEQGPSLWLSNYAARKKKQLPGVARRGRESLDRRRRLGPPGGSPLPPHSLSHPHPTRLSYSHSGIRCIVTVECTEARPEGLTPSRYTTQKVRRKRDGRGVAPPLIPASTRPAQARGRRARPPRPTKDKASLLGRRPEMEAAPGWRGVRAREKRERRKGPASRHTHATPRPPLTDLSRPPPAPTLLSLTHTPPHPHTHAQNRKNTPERLELMKYNKYLKRHTLHREVK